jgi:hypothetical protein
MTVSELIECLKYQDQNKRVVISGYEGGYDDVTKFVEINLRINVWDNWYYGKHDIADSSDDPTESCIHIL